MSSDKVQRVAEMLHRSAVRRAPVSYQVFHRIFDRTDRIAARNAALADAVRLLARDRPIDYGVLLTLDNGLPAKDFFERFRRTRPDEYALAIGVNVYRESVKRKRLLVEDERQRVYADARLFDLPIAVLPERVPASDIPSLQRASCA